MESRCYICDTQIPEFQWQRGTIINCPVCGKYEPTEYFLQRIFENGLKDRYLLSGAIRENYENGIIFKINSAQDLLDSVVIPKNPLESIDRILLYIVRKLQSANENFFVENLDYSIAYARNSDEYYYFFQIAESLGYLQGVTSHAIAYRIAVDGWKHLSKLTVSEKNLNQAFVAMWFNPDLNDAWENGLRPALNQTGYNPMRIDLSEHNEKIDDRIIAEIRKSGLLVADFTGQRGGVYFEAGFAMGLGIPVIWTCRDTDIERLHFDTRQYNHIVWNDAEELRIKLINRIEATLPNRPKSRPLI